MAKFIKLSLAIFALIFVTSLVTSEARELKANTNSNEPLKPQTFPPFDRIFGNPMMGGGSTLGVPQFRLPSGGGSSLGGLGGLGGTSSSIPGFSGMPGMPGMPGRAAANTLDNKKP